MESLVIYVIQAILGRKGPVKLIMTSIARFGYLIYILYGMVEWFRPAPAALQQKRRRSLLYALFSVIIGSLISFFISLCWSRPRPFVHRGRVEKLIDHKANASFPSNHSANSFTISLELLRRHSLMGIPFFLWSWVIGFSRIYSGVHYVTDILAGFLLGLASHIVVVRSKWATHLAASVCYGYAVLEKMVRTWWHL